jgi:acetyl-CoA acyltransferase
MRDVVIIGVGMTPFGKFLDKSLADLGQVAVWDAIRDANIPPQDIQVAYVGNALGATITGQEGIKGQVILEQSGLYNGIPIINVENACASGSTALRGAWMEVALGIFDIALALGVEKLYCEETARSVKAMTNSAPLLGKMGLQYTCIYAMEVRDYMNRFGMTIEQIAKVVVKNSYNGSLNPYAQHRKPLSAEDVLNSRMVAAPLTLYMCSSVGDGAAAAIVCSKDVARKYTSEPLIQIAASALRSGQSVYPQKLPDEFDPLSRLTGADAYEFAGIGPEDIDIAELHDAMAPAELLAYDDLGFCVRGEAGHLIESGRTAITGDKPVNTSGGLSAKGHPIAATGLAQVAEIVWQLRGEAGQRQVTNNPKVGMTHNQGGFLGSGGASCAVTILKK